MHGSVDFTFFYLLDTLKGIIVPIALVVAAAADVAAQEWRATLFSLLAAEASVSFIFGAAVGGALSAYAAACTSVLMSALNIVVTAVFMQGARL